MPKVAIILRLLSDICFKYSTFNQAAFFNLIRIKVLLTKKSENNPSPKTKNPEKSCKNPSATSPPNIEARIAVIVNLTRLQKIAIGAAEKNIIHFLELEQNVYQDKIELIANMVVRDRRPEQASTTSRVVVAK